MRFTLTERPAPTHRTLEGRDTHPLTRQVLQTAETGQAVLVFVEGPRAIKSLTGSLYQTARSHGLRIRRRVKDTHSCWFWAVKPDTGS